MNATMLPESSSGQDQDLRLPKTWRHPKSPRVPVSTCTTFEPGALVRPPTYLLFQLLLHEDLVISAPPWGSQSLESIRRVEAATMVSPHAGHRPRSLASLQPPTLTCPLNAISGIPCSAAPTPHPVSCAASEPVLVSWRISSWRHCSYPQILGESGAERAH